MKTNVEIWTSEAWSGPKYSKSVTFEPPPGILETIKELDRGNWVDPTMLPKAMYFQYDQKFALPDLFRIRDRLMVVSERLVCVLRNFDLGKTQLIEIPLFMFDRQTLLPGCYFILNAAEHKEGCFVREQSKGRIRGITAFQPAPWSYNGIAVRASALAGADLWMDPILRRTPFFSGRLARAIKKGKFGRTGLKPCIIVP